MRDQASDVALFRLLGRQEEPILHKIVAHLDPSSRIALSLTCTRLTTPVLLSFFKALTIDRDTHQRPEREARAVLDLGWPSLAPPPEKLILVARPSRETGAIPDHDQLDLFLQRQELDGPLLQSIASLTLKDWVLSCPGASSTHLLKLLERGFPSLTHLKLDRCTAFETLLSMAPKHLPHLAHLELLNAQPDRFTNNGPTMVPATAGLAALTSLSLVTPHTHQHRMDVSPVATLVRLQRLELALPATKLTGLGAIGQACTQLTQLRFVFSSMGAPGLELKAQGEVVAWPHLVEAHVLVPSDLLLQLGLHTQQTAPSLQRLHVQCICSHNCSQTARDASAHSMDVLAVCSALQQPLVVHCSTDLAIKVKLLSPLADKLQHLVLCHTCLRATDTPARVLPALRDLPHLTCLTLGGVDPTSALVLDPLLLAQQQLTRVIIGIRTLRIGLYGRQAPTQKDTQAWCRMLRSLLGRTRDSGSRNSSAAVETASGQVSCLDTPTSVAATSTPTSVTAAEAASAAMVLSAAPAVQAAPAATAPAAAPAGPTTATPAKPPVHIHFGAWCPASRIDHQAVQHDPHYQQLRQLADQSGSSSAAQGRFRLHECDGGSASDMALGADSAWLEPHFDRLMQLWDRHGPHRWEEVGSEYNYSCCSDVDEYAAEEVELSTQGVRRYGGVRHE